MTAEQASAELQSLMHDEDKKWFYSYALGAGCTTEDNNEISVAIRRRDAELRAVIAEYREGHEHAHAGDSSSPGACSDWMRSCSIRPAGNR